MDKKNIPSILKDALEEKIPSSKVSLWPAVKASLVAGSKFQQGVKMNQTQPRRFSRVAYATLLLIALFTFAFITPQGRAFAQSVLQFFTRAESNTFPLEPAQIVPDETASSAPTAEPPTPIIRVAEAEAQAGFDAAELPFVPKGFNYLGARLYGNAISIEYEAQGGGGYLMIFQSQDDFFQSEWDQAPVEAISQVKVGELHAEIVQGTYVVYPGETVARWNSDAPTLRLRWISNGIWIEMAKFGDVERIEYLDQAGLIKLAESLTTEPFALDMTSVETQAGFDVSEPVKLPEGLTFLGASFDPLYNLVSLSYGYSMADRRILIKQQPINSEEVCDLCGIVGASASVQTVQIGDVTGEYAEGVWELTETGPVWRDDPYLKTIRWQKGGKAFELIFMGMELGRDELVAIAASLR